MSASFIYRYEVPVDDQWHEFDLMSEPLAVGCRRPDVVEFWAYHTDAEHPITKRRRFIVVGTGHKVPDGASRHWGHAYAAGGQLVWHLMEGR